MVFPHPQGLYDAAAERDACGVAFVADVVGRRSHDVVAKGLSALCRLDHRGAIELFDPLRRHRVPP